MSVRCGYCKGLHESVAKARSCQERPRRQSELDQIADHGRSHVNPYSAQAKQEDAAQRRRNPSPPEKLLRDAFKKLSSGYWLTPETELHGYVVDLYCQIARVAIEIDGRVHNGQRRRDELRDEVLTANGVKVVRIPARDIFKDAQMAAKRVLEIVDTPQARERLRNRRKKPDLADLREQKARAKALKILSEEAARERRAIEVHNARVISAQQSKTLKAPFICVNCGKRFIAARATTPKCYPCGTTKHVAKACNECGIALGKEETVYCAKCLDAKQAVNEPNATSQWRSNRRHRK
ncbi:MAG: very-short-patch-repair endonuclease [Candidatus Poriferisodalaceae bacterium]|jgi:very-short-patch-repair endonuclease